MSPAVENLPTTHGNTLLEVPVDAHAYPAGQPAHNAAPDDENVPISHNVHTTDPATAAKLPAGHATHAVLPALYLPGSHCEHVVAVTTPVLQEELPYPARHVMHRPVDLSQVLQPTPPTDATSPHGVHAPAPSKAYVLLGQS